MITDYFKVGKRRHSNFDQPPAKRLKSEKPMAKYRSHRRSTTTFQNDNATVYKYRRMAYKKKKKWVRFVKKVHAAAPQATKTMVRYSTGDLLLSAGTTKNDQQDGTIGTLMTGNGGGGSGSFWDDMQELFLGEFGTTNTQFRKIFLKSAILKVQLANTSQAAYSITRPSPEAGQVSTQTLSNLDTGISVNVYELAFSKKALKWSGGNTFTNFNGWLEHVIDRETGSVNKAINGWTPYASPALAASGMKVLSHRQHNLKEGQSIQMLFKMKMNKSLESPFYNTGTLGQNNLQHWCIPGKTKVIYITWQVNPGGPENGNVGDIEVLAERDALTFQATRTYYYKVIQDNLTTANYVAGT